jgi:hypothetical protein
MEKAFIIMHRSSKDAKSIIKWRDTKTMVSSSTGKVKIDRGYPNDILLYD